MGGERSFISLGDDAHLEREEQQKKRVERKEGTIDGKIYRNRRRNRRRGRIVYPNFEPNLSPRKIYLFARPRVDERLEDLPNPLNHAPAVHQQNVAAAHRVVLAHHRKRRFDGFQRRERRRLRDVHDHCVAGLPFRGGQRQCALEVVDEIVDGVFGRAGTVVSGREEHDRAALLVVAVDVYLSTAGTNGKRKRVRTEVQ